MSGPVHLSFGEWLKQKRRAAGITREDLADQAACSSITLQKIESGERRPSRQMALSLATIFHVPVDEHEAFVTFARTLRPTEPGLAAPSPEPALTPAPWRAVHLSRSNLPLPLTSLIGREHEQANVCRLLTLPKMRLLTLTGPPGTGKTRLSLAVATAFLGDFADGVYLVELAPLSDPALVLPAIARTLDLRETGGQSIAETLLAHIKDKRLLLVLDNFEHLLDAGAAVVQVLQASPWLKVLVTSREALHVRGERQYPVPPLRLPVLADKPSFDELTRNPAVQLFVERAEDAAADFALTAENAGEVAAVCINLDGLPLAIELAAARVARIPPHALLAQLGQQLAVLTDGARDLPPRQRTLRAAIAWSYDLLAAEHQQLFRCMAVFRGGYTLAGLEAVCTMSGRAVAGTMPKGDVAAGVATLLAGNLLHQRAGCDGEPRFGMLEMLHEYAGEQLKESGEAAALQRAHARYCMRLAEEAEAHLRGARQQEWLTRLEEEHDNIRAALAWAGGQADNPRDGQSRQEAAEIGLRTAGAIWDFWLSRSLFTEGRGELERLLSLPERVLHACSPGSRAKALNGAGYLAMAQRDNTAARTLLERALMLGREAGDKQSMANSLTTLGTVTMHEGDDAGARALYEQSLALRRELADKAGLASSLTSLAILLGAQGDYTRARALFEEGLALQRELDNTNGISICLSNLGSVAHEQGDYAAAGALFAESLALDRQLGSKGDISYSLTCLGLVAKDQGDYIGARALLAESLALSREIRHKVAISLAVVDLGHVAQEQGNNTEARALFEEGLAIALENEDKWQEAAAMNGLAGVAQEQADYTGARALFEESLAMLRGLGANVSMLGPLHGLAGVLQEQEDYAGARALYKESLEWGRKRGHKKAIAASLAGLGGVALGLGESAQGVQLLGAAEGLLGSMGAVLDRVDRRLYERAVASARSRLLPEAFDRAWQAGREMSMELAIAYALESVTAS